MHAPHRPTASRTLLLLALLALTAALLPLAPAAAAPPPLPPEIAERARLLASQPPNDIDLARDFEDADRPRDPQAPVERLADARARLDDLRATADGRTATLLRRSAGALGRAVAALRTGAERDRPTHLDAALDDLQRAVANLGRAQRTSETTRLRRDIRRVRFEVAGLVGQIVEPILRRAEAAIADDVVLRPARTSYADGLDKLSSGDADGAVAGFNDAFFNAGSLIVFDVEVFEQNLRDTLDGEAVGYTYAIAQSGTIVAEDGVGQARTAVDGAAPQYADKQVQVASVSKTLTAILILRLMEENGVDPGEAIGSYLPGNWVLGNGMAQITFAQLMTHTSGLKQLANTLPDGSGIGQDYDGLRTLVGLDLTAGPGPYGYAYTNVGFSLLRVLTFGLMGGDVVDYPEFEGETLTASAFAIYLESVYGGIGVPASCTPTDPTPTLMHLWPLDGSGGGESDDKVLECGAYGYFISAHQLAGVLANLRYTENLLSEAQRDVMRDELFGLATYGGEQGTYYGHSGQWNPGLTSCVMMFSINVDAALTINSIGGNYGSTCGLVRTAFDNAWVAA